MKSIVKIINEPNLTIYEKMILIVIASYGAGKVGATVSAREISQQGSMSIRQFHNCIKTLEEKGLIERILNKGSDGANLENTYILKIKSDGEQP